MPSFIPVDSSPASTASAASCASDRKRVDLLTRFCGLSLPALFERIGTMAAHGQPAKTTPTCIASGPAERLDNRRRMEIAKPSSRPAPYRPVQHRPVQREPMSARAGP